MTYQLGVDLGTTYTAAAISRDGQVEMATLGTTSPVMPSVVLLRADGEVLEGEVAVRRGLAEPTRVAREFKRRLGDPTPLVLGGTPYGAEALMGHLLRAVLRTVSEREGDAPTRVVLTHPANFGPYKLDMMREVARLGGLNLDITTFLTEPEAAAISYATRNRVEPDEIVAVYDFGGGTFDAAMVQRSANGFALIGRPEGMERFGGIDIDAAIVAHVDQMLDGAISSMNGDDPSVQAGVARLKDDCRAAKEALSGDTDTAINVSLPGLQTQVRLTRGELEEMVRPRIRETIEALDRAVRSAGITMDRVSRVLLVGGSSRMPLVAEMIRSQTGRPVAVDAHPKFAIAMGAAAHGTAAVARDAAATMPTPVVPAPPAPPATTPPVATSPPTPPAAPPRIPSPPTAPTPSPAPQPRPVASPTAPPSTPSKPADKKKLYIILGGIAAVIAIIIGVVALSGGDDPQTEDTRPPRTTPERTDPPETDPITEPTIAETIPPDTLPTGVLSLDDLRGVALTVADLNAGYSPLGEVPPDDDNQGICNVTQTVFPTSTFSNQFVKGAGTVDVEQLTYTSESYPDVATAQAAIAELRAAFATCGDFSVIDATGTEIRVAPQLFNETPLVQCDDAVSIRLDARSLDGTPLTTRIGVLELCGQNAVSVVIDLDPTSTLGTAGDSPIFNELSAAVSIGVIRLVNFAGTS